MSDHQCLVLHEGGSFQHVRTEDEHVVIDKLFAIDRWGR